jgi:hypothetical protein
VKVVWEAVALTGRQTAPGLLICASVLVASLLILEKRSLVAAAGLGAIAAAIAGLLGKSGFLVAAQIWLYGASSFILLIAGVQMNSIFLKELSRSDGERGTHPEPHLQLSLYLERMVVVAWVVFVEGVEVIINWSATKSQYGASAAWVGVLVSASLVGALGGALFATGIFGELRRDLLQGLAAVTITSCGAYFLARWAAVFS